MLEKNCRNCKHYVAFYRKADGKFIKMLDGICGNRKPSGHRRRTEIICGEYEKIDLTAEKENDCKSILDTLNKISGNIEEIKLYLSGE